jgi:hypothetical protein
VFLLKEFQSLIVFAFPDQGDIALDAGMRRTGGLTWGGAPLGYAECPRDGLGILLEDGPAKIDAFVVFIGQGDRADLGAFAAACTLA